MPPSVLVLVLFAVMNPGAPSPAHACGGLFCNQPPPNPLDPLPVAQNGENVVFAMSGDLASGTRSVVAHVQILYQGDAAQFSWVVPMEAAPTLIEAGTDQLFSTLASLTNPSFRTNTVTEGTCLPPPAFSARDGGVSIGAGTGGATSSGAGGAGATSGVTVVFQGAVGPYDTAVIKSDDPGELKTWLTDNGYFLGADASAIIDDYVKEQKFFLALKLLNGKDVRSIRPIVLTFSGTEPCVPLRLTAIAAINDMQVRVWVLGAHRAVPLAFLEVKVDEARIDWSRGGANYTQVLAEAANDAGGNAFAVEYAGTSTIAASALWTAGRFDLTNLRAAQIPPTYVQALIALGIANDPQVLPLLAKYIPKPAQFASIPDATFYGNLPLYWSQAAFPAYDLVALTAEIEAAIIEPRRKAQQMINDHTYLTRLNTFISPIEMDRDPLFAFNADLPEVSSQHTATFRLMCGNRQYMACNAPVRLELADGRMAWVRRGTTGSQCNNEIYNLEPLGKLPAAEFAWAREETGEGARLVDNTDKIMAGLAAHNASFIIEERRFPIPVEAGGSGMGGGCGCAVGAGAGAALGIPALLAALAITRVRSRRRGRGGGARAPR
jgi:hypothetical protein